MSDDSEDLRPPPGRSSRRVMALTTSSDSESDDDVVALSSRRKRMRVVSDEDSDSSGSSIGRPFTRRIRVLPQLRDSDSGSDVSENNSHIRSSQAAGPSARASGFASDSSEGNSEKCSICLMRFTDQEVGTPQTCEHIFCLDCITEWSKSVNTCPVDRLSFDAIVVRACAGGRVLRTEPVQVVPRRSSVDTIFLLDSRTCQICGDTNSEETMLLCDGCDLGYHMHCLNPPLPQIPIGDWYCPYCDNNGAEEEYSEIDDLISNIDFDFLCPMGPRSTSSREPRNFSRGYRQNERHGTVTSVFQHSVNNDVTSVPSTSRGSRSTTGSSSFTTRRRGVSAYAPRRKKRRTKTVILEYEIGENSKRPLVNKYKRKNNKKGKKRKSRTAARLKLVRQRVRAKLATLKLDQSQELSRVSTASNEVQSLCIQRHRAGIPTLSLLGNPNQFDYFSDEEHEVSEGASTMVAIRSTSNLLNSHRQARRKMMAIPSPRHASSAPDFLSSILESQTLLHSKKSVLSISADGNVNVKLKSRLNLPQKKSMEIENNGRLDLSKGVEGAKQAPSYPGHSRGGGGGWGGGYRGNYHRERGTTGFGRGSYNDGDYPGGPQSRQGNHFQRNDAGHRDEPEVFADYARRTHRLQMADEPQFDRHRRYSDSNRGLSHSGYRHNEPPVLPAGHGHLAGPVHSAGHVPWRPYGTPSVARTSAALHHRHSFGGFDDPLDMRTSGAQPHAPIRSPLRRPETFIEEAQLPTFQPCRPLPNPPVFSFDSHTDLDKSEDERSDPDLVIDTDKYDPTEPTHDDDSPDEQTTIRVPLQEHRTRTLSQPPLPTEAAQSDALRGVLAGLEVNVPSSVLDSAVRQVLQEHRDLLAPQPPPASSGGLSDEDSDGDCPNFSIYSATSVHIANNTSALAVELPPQRPGDGLEDLVQEDDDGPSPTPAPETTPAPIPTVDLDATLKVVKLPPTTRHYNFEVSAKKKSEEYKEKVSKRCPITTNPRNPIKIKLNTPSLIKRPVSLYDEDDEEEVAEEPLEPSVLEPAVEDKSPYVTANTVSNFVNITIESNERHIFEADGGESSQTFKPIEDASSIENDNLEATVELCDEKHNTNNINKVQAVASPLSGSVEHAITAESENAQSPGDPFVQEDECNGPVETLKASQTDESSTNASETEEHSPLPLASATGVLSEQNDLQVSEKMTESISETEDERSYTPCLDEHKSKDTSLETDKDKGIEGLDTEMISEDEGNEMFTDEDQARSVRSHASPEPATPLAAAEEEPASVKKPGKNEGDTKKKKKKDSKKEGKDRAKAKRKADVVFRKLSKSGKERNYREREKQAAARDRRGSSASAEREKRKRKRKEKRKDLERYDVRTVVGEKKRKRKDAFGRDVSPLVRSHSPSLSSPRRSATPRRRSPTPRRSSPLTRNRSTSHRRSPSSRRHSPILRHRTPTPRRRSPSPRRRSLSLRRRSPSPRHRSPTPRRRSPTAVRCSQTRARVSLSPVPRRRRTQSVSRVSPSPGHVRRTRSPRSLSPRRPRPASRTRCPETRPAVRRRRGNPERARKRRRSASGSRSPRPKSTKRKKRARSERATSRRRKSPRRRGNRRRSPGRGVEPSPGPTPPVTCNDVPAAWSPASLESRPPSPCTPPPAIEQEDAPRRRRDLDRTRHRRARDAGGASKEVFTSGDNILVSVSFKEQEHGQELERRTRRKERRRRRRRTAAPEPEGTTVRPVAIIDLERSPFRELTPSPRDIIVLSDSDAAERDPGEASSEPAPPQQPSSAAPAPTEENPSPIPDERGPTTPPEPPDSPDAYDPYEPTRSASGSPSPALPASPPRTAITLETAQKTNMSADDVIDRRPLSPIEKVMALLQSTREVSPDPPPQSNSPIETAPSTAAVAPTLVSSVAPGNGISAPAPTLTVPVAPVLTTAPPVRIVLPEAARPQAPKLFLAKPSPIKSDPIKPMPKPSRPLPAEADSPYSPGSSDFGELFSPPAGGRRDPFDVLIERAARRAGRTSTHSGRAAVRAAAARSAAARVPVRLDRKQGKTQVGVKIDEDNLKILDDLPSSAVEMQVKSKFLKKLNRQERVVEEVKLVLKPHYNKKHVTKDEYKDILRRAVPKICHNKSGEINPTKIQALVEAYVKKVRKKHKLGLL